MSLCLALLALFEVNSSLATICGDKKLRRFLGVSYNHCCFCLSIYYSDRLDGYEVLRAGCGDYVEHETREKVLELEVGLNTSTSCECAVVAV